MNLQDDHLIKNLAQSAQLVNALNGGMAEPIVQFEEHEDEWLYKVRMPGVDPDHLDWWVHINREITGSSPTQ